MEFLKAYEALKVSGSKSLDFQTGGSKYVDVWASELLSGSKKGAKVIRVQWANSSSSISEPEWNTPKTSLIKHLRTAIMETLAEPKS